MKPTIEQEQRAAQTTRDRQISIEEWLSAQPARTQDDDDTPRLNDQCLRVYRALRDLRPHTLSELSATTGDGESSVSARIRECRAYLEDRKKGQREPGPAAKGTIKREAVPGGNGLNIYTLILYRYYGAA